VLSELAGESNCQGFLSIDNDNFEQGLLAFSAYPGVWKLALMQQDQDQLSSELMPAIRDRVKHGEIINFPYHRAASMSCRSEPIL